MLAGRSSPAGSIRPLLAMEAGEYFPLRGWYPPVIKPHVMGLLEGELRKDG